MNDRRPIAARQHKISQLIAKFLAARGITPNAISVSSVIFSVLAAGAFFFAASGTSLYWLIGAVMILMRLLANMFDGMVAVEHGQASPVGDLYNEIPDRVSDSVVLIALGYLSPDTVSLGYLAAIFAIFTAYVRTLGRANGTASFFGGIMAKQQRMFTIIAFAVLASLWPELVFFRILGQTTLYWLLCLITVGSLITNLTRLRAIARALRERS